MKDIKKSIKENDVMMLVIPNQNYAGSLGSVAKTMSKTFNKICYISLNKPRESLINGFKKKGVDTEKFFFIDAVGKGTSSDDVSYVSSPKALTELNIAIIKALSGVVDSSLFDSLSTLLIYEEPSTVIKFSHSIISAFRNKKIKAVLTCLGGDAKSDLIKDLSMFVDKVIKL